MRLRTLVVVLVLGLLIAGLLGVATPASAYCDPFWSEVTGRCDNGCTAAARAFQRVTGQPAPWYCPM